VDERTSLTSRHYAQHRPEGARSPDSDGTPDAHPCRGYASSHSRTPQQSSCLRIPASMRAMKPTVQGRTPDGWDEHRNDIQLASHSETRIDELEHYPRRSGLDKGRAAHRCASWLPPIHSLIESARSTRCTGTAGRMRSTNVERCFRKRPLAPRLSAPEQGLKRRLPNHSVVRDLRVCNLGVEARFNPGCISLFHRRRER